MAERRFRNMGDASRGVRIRNFIEALAAGGSVSEAAHSAGGSPAFFHEWRETDPEFDAAWKAAEEDGRDLYQDGAADLARRADREAEAEDG